MSIPSIASSTRPQFRPRTKESNNTPPPSPLPTFQSREPSRASVLKAIVPPPSFTHTEASPIAEGQSKGLFSEAPRIRSRLTPLATPTRRIPNGSTSNLVTPIKRKVAFPTSEPINQFDTFKNPFLTSYESSGIDKMIGLGLGDTGATNVIMKKGKENVKVTVRIRPPASRLAASTSGSSDEAWAITESGAIILENGNGPEYHFDAVVKSTDNEAVYQAAAKDLVLQAMVGYDAVIFAYGQTASGKTFTLGGSATNPGITPRAVDDVFSYIRAHPEKDFLLRASYLEIYNETLKDLLAPGVTGMKVRQDEQKKFFVTPLHEEVVTGEAQVAQLLLRGARNRATGKTDFNEQSSRSHSVFQMTIESRTIGLDSNSSTLSKLAIIDLAGSESATSQNERKAEGAAINKSLLALEKVISSLTGKPKEHIPYRDSKLTQLLQSNLSGNGLVSVIATLNPSMTAISESTSTLKFAQRVKKVTLKAVVHEVIDDKMLISKYRSHIALLESQLLQASSQIPSTPRRDQESEMQLNAMRVEIQELQNLFLNSSNLDDRRQSLAPPRAVSPMKGSNSFVDEEKFQETLDICSAQEDKILELQQRMGELEEELIFAKHSEPSTEEKDIVEKLLKENRELRLVINQGEAENQTSQNLQEARFRRLLANVEASLEIEKSKNAKFERFIVDHLTSRESQINYLSPSHSNAHPRIRTRNVSFGIESISNQEFELDQELEDLEISYEGRERIIRSASTINL